MQGSASAVVDITAGDYTDIDGLVRGAVMDGASLSDALAAREDVFQNYYISIVRTGESTGGI